MSKSKKTEVLEVPAAEVATEVQPEVAAPAAEVKRGPGRPKGSTNGPKAAAELVLTFSEGELKSGNGAQLTDKGWTVDGYTLADAEGELAAIREAFAKFTARVAALRGLPVITTGDYALSMKGHTPDNQKAIFAYMTK